MAHNNLQEL
jgi:hypothetical protein